MQLFAKHNASQRIHLAWRQSGICTATRILHRGSRQLFYGENGIQQTEIDVNLFQTKLRRILKAIEEVAGGHSFLASLLEVEYFEPRVGSSDEKAVFLRTKRARLCFAGLGSHLGFENLQVNGAMRLGLSKGNKRGPR